MATSVSIGFTMVDIIRYNPTSRL